MKRILLISYNFSPELTGIGKYNGEMIEWLAKSGYDCSVLTAYPYYPDWRIQEAYRRKRFFYSTEETTVGKNNAKITVLRCPLFVPRKPSGMKRMMLDLSFFVTALVRLITLVFFPKYDFVIAVSPSFQVGLLGVLYKKLKGAKLLYHIQDLQIEAARDLKMIKSEAVVNTMLKVEKQVMHHADMVSTISEEMVKKVEVKSGKRTMLFPNWTNVEFFRPIADRNALKKEFGFDSDDRIVLYSGAIGEKQGLESILFAASRFKEIEPVKFVICGTGPYKDILAAKAADLHLGNVVFMPLQPLESFNRFLNLADIHLVIQKASAGDLVMPSKLGAILAVGGKMIITANAGTALHSLVSKNNIGTVVPAGDNEELVRELNNLLWNEGYTFNARARKYAERYLGIDMIMAGFEHAIMKLTPTYSSASVGTSVDELSQAGVPRTSNY